MRKFLTIFSICCIIIGAASLMCVTCHLRMLSDHCRRGFGVCVAQKHETCMTLKIYQSNTLQLSYMGCQRFCNNLSFNFNNRTYVHKCCSYDHCNFIA
uniref:Prostate and testis expressed 3 n=1 Tax=Jaculus jaculus TaxID=51337 RepID=A0A8C5K720_JACJA